MTNEIMAAASRNREEAEKLRNALWHYSNCSFGKTINDGGVLRAANGLWVHASSDTRARAIDALARDVQAQLDALDREYAAM